jgi:hypothetical protein
MLCFFGFWAHPRYAGSGFPLQFLSPRKRWLAGFPLQSLARRAVVGKGVVKKTAIEYTKKSWGLTKFLAHLNGKKENIGTLLEILRFHAALIGGQRDKATG